MFRSLTLGTLTVVLVALSGFVGTTTRADAGQLKTATPQQVIDEAATTLGGRDRILAVKTLVIDGFGNNPNLGQQMTPESELLLWMLPDFKRSIDLEHRRMSVELTRRPAFPAVFDNQRQIARLDGDLAFNVPAAGRGGPAGPARASEQVARDRQLEMLHHPLTALRAALNPGAKLVITKQTSRAITMDVTVATAQRFTLVTDAVTKRPLSVTTSHDQVNLGDVLRTTTFSGYADTDGIELPKHLVTTIDRWVEYDIGVMKNTLDADLGDLAAPDSTRNAPPAAAAQNVPVTDVAKGIWFLGGGMIPSLVVEFADHVAIVEAPGGDARVQAVLTKAKALVPGKPITQVVVSHHHFDHTAGIRAAVAEGLTIVTQKTNEAWFRSLMTRPHTIAADLLAKAPKPLKIVSVDDSLTIKDAAMEMQLVHIVGATHGDGMLAVYFPAQRVYAEPDVWNPGAQIQPHLRSLYADITRRGLKIDTVLPLHGTAPQPYAALLKDVEQWTGIKVAAR